jgi:hypothetical protein
MTSVHPAEERSCAPEEHFIPATDSLVADRLRQVALANARPAMGRNWRLIGRDLADMLAGAYCR